MTPPDESPTFGSVHTTSLPPLLNALGSSLLATTYQAGKLILVRSDGGVVNTHFRDFDVPMGLASDGTRLALGTKTQVIEFVNQPAVAAKLEPPGKHDAVYVPRSSHVTGFIAGHEMAYAGGELWVVNTRFSCLCTLNRDASFTPRWRPKFITALAPEDRCHLNGLGVRDRKVRYVTALGDADTVGGWRPNKATGGLLFDLEEDRVIARDLCMPHSPRWYAGKLWVLESGAGTLCTVNEITGARTVVASLPGFTRGLDFADRFAFVGMSQVRDSAAFGGLPITQREDRSCGVWVVDITSGQTVAFLRFEGSVREIFAVQLLPGIRYPDLLPMTDPLVSEAFVLPDSALEDVPKALRG